ncbi:MAG TPA: BTAD domain-containing putative transcriptional regulator [Ktedonobacteraceae bacterium]|nr:BTAD domain-containing putative transcriptional regulator [Ktedonobacteraceae bacterium]
MIDTGMDLRNDPLFRIRLWGPFRVEKRVGEEYEPVKTADWGGSNYPRLLLKALLCCPGRRGRREALIDLLWPDIEIEQATVYLNTATTKLRQLLRQDKNHESLLLTEHDATIYHLPDQGMLWVDSDAVHAAMAQAERVGRTSVDALALLEEAINLSDRGTFLEAEEAQWATEKRATRERERYCGRIWLAESYEQQGMPWQAETILTTLLELDPFDEDVLCRFMMLLQRQGMAHQALRFYRRTRELFESEHLELTEATQNLAASLEKQRHPLFLDGTQEGMSLAFHRRFDSSTLSPDRLPWLSPDFSTAPQHIIMQMQQDRKGNAAQTWMKFAEKKEDMDKKRRELLQLLSTASLTLALPFPRVDWERMESALIHPSLFDEAVLGDLEMMNRSLWNLYLTTSKKASVFDGALGQWKTLVQFLRDPHSASMHQRLYTLASEISQLVGEIAFDLSDYPSAQASYTFAALAAKEAGAFDLWSCALVRHAFLPLYQKQYGQALPLLQEAHLLAQRGDQTLPTRFWVAAVEAETHAGLLDLASCQRALDQAQEVLNIAGTDLPWVRFHADRLPALRGTCYVRLSQPGLAEPALQEALQHFPLPGRKRGMVLTDLVATALQCGDGEQARTYIDEVVSIVAQGASGFLREELRQVSQKGRIVAVLPVKEIDSYIGQQLQLPNS